MSTALTGPAANLGVEMRAGVLAAIAEQNDRGGIQGRRIELIALDDGYEPDRTGRNMHQLIDTDHVLAVIGNVGTPTAIAALPVAESTGTLFYGAFSGSGALRKDPPSHWVVNFRASYAEETGAMVDQLIDVGHLAPEEIAFFTQRDTYGDAGIQGGMAALARHGLTDPSRIAHGTYERNTVAVENALADILLARTPPRAVIMVGAYAPTAAFVKLARETGLESLFLSVSFVGTRALAKALGPLADRIIVTQVVPHFDAAAPLVADYRRALQAQSAESTPDFGSLEGYVTARILFKALSSNAPSAEPLTRASVVDALESLGQFDIGLGAPLELSPREHQACHRIWPTILRNGRVESFAWSELPALLAGP